jgi:hypothetical protein
MERAKTKSAARLMKPLLFMVIGCATGLLYAFLFYEPIRAELFLGGGTGLFLSLSYYLIEFHWLKSADEGELKQFIKGIILYTPVLTIIIFMLLLMNDIAMALQDYGDLTDVPVSLGVLPYTLLFAFFASFIFQSGKLFWGKK